MSLTATPKHPLQPFVIDDLGTRRFKANKIVRFLLDNGPFDMNVLALRHFADEDREQFAQLIGYSRDGFDDLSYVTDETRKRVQAAVQRHDRTLGVMSLIKQRKKKCGKAMQ